MIVRRAKKEFLGFLGFLGYVAGLRLRAKVCFSVAPRYSLGEKPTFPRSLISQSSIQLGRKQVLLTRFNSVFQIRGSRHLPRSRGGECFSPSEFVGPAFRERLKNTVPPGTGSQKPIPNSKEHILINFPPIREEPFSWPKAQAKTPPAVYSETSPYPAPSAAGR